MGYNPETNTLVQLDTAEKQEMATDREWTRFSEGEYLAVKGVVFRVHEIGETRLVLKPVKKEALRV